ncbi:PEST proteolytic signal-containing nuclear protein [Diabrotica virgifera virgifera]|uniref:PEST proteolytic signal-containing nuclear protein n=1 Tax=Diabrotica virgifera virgifera TaxID=50390 RepID=A0A6P7GD06_DIAVI|nr:PEST proteolytic signal-containing nuclear protein [Diabrotica virgifera virgifera]
MSSRNQGSSANGSHAAKRERSRSRSPRRHEDRLPNKRDRDSKDERKDETHSSKSADNVGLGAKNRLKSISIQMKLGDKKAPLPKPKMTVANVFNQDSDSEPEEMPAIARMRMKNIGRDTPTSSGPNSFGKTKHGFSDAKKLFEKTLKEAMESARADD